MAAGSMLAVGTLLHSKVSFISDNAAKLNYSKGEAFLLEAGVPEDRWWTVRRLATGEVGKVAQLHLEAKLTPDQWQSHSNALATQLDTHILPALRHPGTESTEQGSSAWFLLACISSSKVGRRLLFERYEALEPLLLHVCIAPDQEATQHTAEDLRNALECLSHLCRHAPSPLQDIALPLLRTPEAIPLLLARARCHDVCPDAEYSKPLRAVATASMKVLSTLAGTLHYESVASDAVMAVALDVLHHKGNLIHRQEPSARAYHLPTYTAYFANLAQHSDQLTRLAEHEGVKTCLAAVTAGDDSAVAHDMAVGVLLLLKPSLKASRVKAVTGGWVMISYNWRHQALALRINEDLKAHGYRTWIDVEKMEGDIMTRMATAVEQAACVLLLYSATYAQSRNCLLEAQYTFQQQVDYIPVFVEEGCQNIKGLLGIMRGTLLYVDMASEDAFASKAQHLRELLGDRGRTPAAGGDRRTPHAPAALVPTATATAPSGVSSDPPLGEVLALLRGIAAQGERHEATLARLEHQLAQLQRERHGCCLLQ